MKAQATRADEQPAAEWVETRSLHEWADNPRNNEDNVSRVADSIRRFGFAAPIVARRNGEIIAGHTRWKAALSLGLERVPVRFMDLSERDAHMLALADNRLNELATWEPAALQQLLSELSLQEAELVGWTEGDLKKMADELLAGGGAEPREVVEDEPPEPPQVAITKPGDVWELGRHRLVCGDSTAVATWALLMGDGESLDMVFTDPPYGVDYVGKTDEELPVHNDDAAGLPGLLAGAFDRMFERSKDGAVWYVCSPAGPNMATFGEAMAARGLWRQVIIWAKDVFVLGHSDFHYQHEPIFYGWKKGTHRPPPDRKQTTLWSFDRPKASREHPTMKPVKLVAHAVAMSSGRGEIVGDAFGGSGTTLIAAEQLERACRIIELSPNYCDVIVERWQNLTGGKAVRRGR